MTKGSAESKTIAVSALLSTGHCVEKLRKGTVTLQSRAVSFPVVNGAGESECGS